MLGGATVNPMDCGTEPRLTRKLSFVLMTAAVPPVHVRNHLRWWRQTTSKQRSYSLVTKLTN